MIHGIGIDIFEVARLERLLESEGDQYLPQLFTPDEIEYGNRQRHSREFFGRFFAAKEAVIKAIASPELAGFYWREIEIRPDANGCHSVHFMGVVRELVEKLRIHSIHIFIQATDRIAIAVAVACGSNEQGAR